MKITANQDVNPRFLPFWASLFGVLGSVVMVQAGPAMAAWTYTADATNDSLGLGLNATAFEIFGMGIYDDGQDIYVALGANLPIGGVNLPDPQLCDATQCYPVPDSNIGWGDLFFDFSGNSEFGTSSDNSQLFGIRFAPSNDSLVPMGVYSNVKGTGVQLDNAGYRNIGRYYNSLPTTAQQQSVNFGSLAWNDPYWSRYITSTNPGIIPNVIGSGTKVGDVLSVTSQELRDKGFNATWGGSQLIGMKFSKSFVPTGNYITTLLEECLNDGIAARGTFLAPPPPPPPPPVEVPESSMLLSILGVGSLSLARKRA
jgi:hypothetical protein